MKATKQFGRCLLCGRVLKKEESEARGYGDICYSKIHSKASKRLFSIKPSELKTTTTPKQTKSVYTIPSNQSHSIPLIYNREMR